MQTEADDAQTEKYVIPFIERTGMRTIEQRAGHAKVLMPLAGNENHVGVMYMAAFTVAAEAAAVKPASGFLDKKHFFPIIKDISVDFRKPATSDIAAEFTLSEADIDALQADLERKDSAGYIADLPLIDADCVTVAGAKATIKLLSHGFKKPAE